MTTSHVTMEHLEDADDGGIGISETELKSSWTYNRMKKRRSEFTQKGNFSVFCGTWNVNNKVLESSNPPDSLDTWLLPPNQPKADIYAVGFQEMVDLNTLNVVLSGTESTIRALYWQEKIKECLEATGERYTLLIERHLVGILFFVIVKDTILTNITDLRGVTTGIGIFGIMGNKGGISVRFNLHETSICFVCAHLRAQQKAVDGRNEDVKMIIERTVLPPNEHSDKPIHGGPSRQWVLIDHHREVTILDHDVVFWLGDLNYRIDYPDITLEEVIKGAESDQWQLLLPRDQLSHERVVKKVIFQDFNEGEITFRPTYKYQPGTNEYEQRPDKKHRAPAWCDRVLWRNLHDHNSIKQLCYQRADLISSDHKPVSSLFTMDADVLVPELERNVFQEILQIMDKWENLQAPKVTVSGNVVDIPLVKLNTPFYKEICVKNVGLGPCTWGFSPKFESDEICADWITFRPKFGIIAPGEESIIKIEIHVNSTNYKKIIDNHRSSMRIEDKKSDAEPEPSPTQLEDISILRVKDGSDFFVMISTFLDPPTAAEHALVYNSHRHSTSQAFGYDIFTRASISDSDLRDTTVSKDGLSL